MATLADGQLSTVANTALYTVAANHGVLTLTLANTSNSLTETVLVTLNSVLGTNANRRLQQLSLAPNESAVISGLSVSTGDILQGSTTDATTVDYTVADGSGPLTVQVFNSAGALKSTASPVTVIATTQFSSINATTGTLAANKASGAAFTALTSTNATPGSQAMRTPAQILADTPGLVVGASYVLEINNQGAGNFTLATDSGSGFTMTGNMVIPQNGIQQFIVTINTATTGTVQALAPTNVLPPAKFSTINVTTGTLAAGNASGAAFTALTSTNGTPGSQAMRTPALVLTDTPGLAVGMSYVLFITNTGAGVFTLATDSGSGFTMTGTMTIAQNTTRTFIVTINSSTTGTVQNIGVGTTS